MAIDAVVTDVQCAVVIPANVQVIFRKADVLDLRERFDPVDATRLLRPETLVVLD